MAKKKGTEEMNLDAFKDVRKDADSETDNPKYDRHYELARKLLSILLEDFPEFSESVEALTSIPDEMKGEILLQMVIAHLGITPEEYSLIYHTVNTMSDIMGSHESESESDMDFGFSPFGYHGRRSSVNRYEPMPDAHKKTLALRIQMKGVTKPPMWREIEVPADFDFLRLHQAIQAVTGLMNSHLWAFNKTAYDTSLQIGIKSNPDNPFEHGIDGVTDEADLTPLTTYLAKKDDKLEYTYDFGDDWIFTVKVLKVIDAPCAVPKCTKWKSDLNALEDYGGPYVYEELRILADKNAHPTKKEIKDLYEEYGGWYDTQKEFLEFIEDQKFDLGLTNAQLSQI